MSITLRNQVKRELTFDEVDGNFQSLFYSSSIFENTLNLYFYGGASQSLNLSVVPSDTASYAYTASYVQNAQSASYVLNAVSSSYASTVASGLNITASNILVTGTASIVYSQIITSSVAFTSGSNLLGANSGNTQTLWGKIDLKSGPLIISGSTTALSSITAPSFTGSLQGTSSWANNAVTSSYILNAVSSSYAATASYVQNAITASYALSSPASTFASSSLSASFASSSISASYASSSTSASYASSSTSASYSTNALSASYSQTASYVLNAVSSSYSTFAQNAFLASTASYTLYTSLATAAITAATASFATSSISASYASSSTSASYASSSTSASYAITSSYTQTSLSSSYASTASYVQTSISSSQSVSASYSTTSSYSTYANTAGTATSATTAGSATTATVATSATTASYALTASYVQNSISSSFAQSALTASFALSVVGGTFPYTGSAIISGSLRNIGNTILSGSTTVYSSSLTVSTGSLYVSLPYNGVDNTSIAATIDRGNNLIPALSVTGSSNFNGALTVGVGTLTAKDNFIASGSSTFTNGGVTVKSGIVITGSTSITGSTTIIGTTTITGSLNVTAGITGSLNGTSSWANKAVSASNISQAITNNTNNYILTATGGGGIYGESSLTFDGSILTNGASDGIIKILDTTNSTIPTSGITSFAAYNRLPDATGEYYGETISGIAGSNLSVGQIIYLTPTPDTWGAADCSNLTTLPSLLGMCLNNASTSGSITILLQGFVVTNAFSSYGSYQPGLPLYLSTGGRVTDTAPGGGQNRIIGHYYKQIVSGTYSIRFNPDNYYV